MRHTFLFEPAVWTATGTFWRADGEAIKATAVTEVTHKPEAWLLAGAMKVLGSPPVEFQRALSIQPATRESGTMRWTSEDATQGKQHGTYTVIGETLMSVHSCAESGYHGAESLARIDEATYRATGVLLLDDRCLSSWELLHRRSR